MDSEGHSTECHLTTCDKPYINVLISANTPLIKEELSPRHEFAVARLAELKFIQIQAKCCHLLLYSGCLGRILFLPVLSSNSKLFSGIFIYGLFVTASKWDPADPD